jgi:hypothetical protein
MLLLVRLILVAAVVVLVLHLETAVQVALEL